MKQIPRMSHYILDEDRNVVPMSNPRKWAIWMSTADRHVAREQVDAFLVGTVFLGIDHGFYMESGPILFETMIFHQPEGKEGEIVPHGAWGSEWEDMFQTLRYETWDEAEEGHALTVETLKRAIEIYRGRTIKLTGGE